MRKAHNLGTVIRFEIVRNLKKVSFWAFAIGMPVLMIGLFAMIFAINQSAFDAADQLEKQKFSSVMIDRSGAVDQNLADTMGVKLAESRESAIDDVRSGKVDAFFYFPDDLTKQSVEIFAKDVGIFDNGRYQSVANSLLDKSVSSRVDPAYQTVLQGQVKISSTTFRDGVEYDGVREMILPGLFLVLFYIMVVFFSNQMLNSTIEEKENRTIEMLLTSVKAKTLISGKIISTVVLAIIQAVIIILPVVFLYLSAGSKMNLPEVDLTNLPVDFEKLAIAGAVFVSGFMMFAGLLVVAGSIMPTAKEASQWLAVAVMLVFMPLYGATSFISYPDNIFVRFLSLFPLTSPVPLLLRNAVGNLPLLEALLGIVILVATSVLVVAIGVRAFRYGAMQYDSRLSLSALRSKRQGDRIDL